MNELADNMIFARNLFVGSLALYASVSLLRNFIVMPFIKTYKFLSNQTRNLENSLQSKYDSGVCVIVGSTTGLGVLYAKYLRTLNFSHFVLIDKDDNQLLQQKKSLCVKAKEKPKIFTIKFDLTGKHNPEMLKQI
jgi:hypothetical protein